MFRFGAVFLLLLNFCFGALDKDEVFKFYLQSTNDGYEININFDKSVYLYANKLQISAKNIDIKPLLDIALPKQKDNNLIYDENFSIFLPLGLLQNYADDEIEININYQGCSNSGFCYPPMQSAFNIDLKTHNIKELHINKVLDEISNNEILANDEIIANSFKTKSMFLLLISFFGYGLLLSFTPCILPMLPILSAIILAKSNKKTGFFSALLYVLSMSLTNAVFGVIAAIFGASVQAHLQKPIVIIISAIIFVFLAFLSFGANFSFFSRMNSAINKKAQTYSGYFGIIFMGILSALVISPCVAAPLAGALLYIANSGDILLGALALFVLSIGMGTPLIALGAGFKFLPKPGIWMEKITKIFGFIMLAMAIWLLSRISDENFIMLFYGLLGIFAFVFLCDFNKPQNFTQKLFLSCLIVLLSLSSALIISFVVKNFSKQNNIVLNNQISHKKISNLDELNLLIKSANKPILVDFWATWCQNCKEFDNTINADILAQNLLSNFEKVIVDLSSINQEKQEILSHFSIFGPPAFLFFKNGNLEYKIVSTPTKDEFLSVLNKILK